MPELTSTDARARPRPAASPVRRSVLVWAAVGYAILRWGLLVNPGYMADVLAYKRWALQAGRFGISQVYRTSDMDYPPLYAYLLAPLGKVFAWLEPGTMRLLQNAQSQEINQRIHASTLFTVLVKLPPLLFDLAIAWLLFRWARARKPGAWSWILPAAYLLNPAVLFDTAYWGEPDSVFSFFLLAAFITLGVGIGFWSRRAAGVTGKKAVGAGDPGREKAGARRITASGVWLAWALLALATCMKPLGAPYFPLLFILSFALYGAGATAIGIGAAAGAALLLFAPFLAQGTAVFHRVLGDVGAMPYTSTNAHNLWWLLGSWRNAEVPWLGPLTATQVAMILFAAAYAALLWKTHRLHRAQPGGIRPAQGLALAAMLGFSFFMLSTHMHENHMFAVIPLLAPLVPEDRTWRRFFIAASLAVLANLYLHDFQLPRHWPFTIGGLTQIQNPDYKRPFYAAEIAAIWLSTAFNLGLYAVAMAGILRGGTKGWLERLAR